MSASTDPFKRTLSDLAAALSRPLEEITRHHLLEGVLRRLAIAPSGPNFALRGSMLTRRWAAPHPRPADDVDFLSRIALERDPTAALFREALSTKNRCGDGIAFRELHAETIWAETDFPGVRLTADLTFATEDLDIQVDIGFGDPLESWPQASPYPALIGAPILIPCVSLETSIAWKAHGLFEFPEGPWRPKDLFDIQLMIANQSIDEDALRRAIRLAFASRHTPLSVAHRLFDGPFGQSRGSARGWRRFVKSHPHRDIPASSEPVIARVAAFLEPHFRALDRSPACAKTDETGRETCPRFPVIDGIDAIRDAIRGRPEFTAYEREGFTVFSYERERANSFPSPLRAADEAEARRLSLLRECRGLSFDAQGQLIARKLHKFFHLGDREESLPRTMTEKPRVLEKLDGSMIAPMLLAGCLRWTTRRGFSGIADQAAEHALAHPSDYEGFARAWIDDGFTPIFEWCSRRHRLVLDYPQSQLVLLALRHLRSGVYRPYEELVEVGARAGIPVVACLEEAAENPQDLAESIHESEGSEGVVLLFSDGRMLKLKSLYYRQIHQLKEQFGEKVLLWRAAAHDYSDDAIAALEGDHRRCFKAFLAAFERALDDREAWLEGLIQKARSESAELDPQSAKRQLVASLPAGLNKLELSLVFRRWKGGESRELILAGLRQALSQRGGLALAQGILGADLNES